jgi:flagellar motor protein MotB
MREQDQNNGENFSLSIGDLMAAMMLVFILLFITTIIQVQQQTIAINRIEDIRKKLYERLNEEFKYDLPNWNASIDSSLTIRFNSDPDFEGPKFYWEISGDYLLSEDHRSILNNFFPRYVKTLYLDSLSRYIKEIRIEGHTDASWLGIGDPYLKNMELSQNRTRSVLEHALTTIDNSDDANFVSKRTWVTGILTSVGHSYSRPIVPEQPNDPQNRRVEFRIDLEEYLILRELQSGIVSR